MSPQLHASNYHLMVLPSLLVFSSWKGGLLDLPLRATFSPAHPLARRNVPLALARAFKSSSPLVKGVAEAALYCAHRTSTVSPCAFCEQEGHLAAPSPSFSGRALREHRRSTDHLPSHPLRRILLPRFFFGEPSIQGRQDHQREGGRGEETADDNGRERPLHLRTNPLREHQRQQT